MRLPPSAQTGPALPASALAAALALASVTLPATTATAADDRGRDLDALVAAGLGQSRGAPVPVPNEAPRLRAENDVQAASQGRVFVNFDGAQLGSGWDDSASNTTQIGECAGNFAAYGEGAKRDATMQAVRDDWAAYNVIITDARPASGNYTMCMTGPSNPFGGGVLGIAPLDCNDEQTPNNIVYAFHSANDSFDASTQATTIGQEVAHSYGLEHVDEPGDVMNPYNAGGDPSFTDVCLTVVGGVLCNEQHAAECGSGSQQNSHRELLTLFGPSMPDNQVPTVSIVSPADGASFDEGASFEIEVEASDDIGIEQVLLYNNGEQIETDASSPYGWTVNDAPAGTYEFYVEALDPAGNTSMSGTVTVFVGVPASDDGGDDAGGDDAPAETGDDGGDGNEGGDDDGGDGTGGDDGSFDEGGDGALPPDYGLDGDEQACACTNSGGTHWTAQWLLLVVVGAGIKRRRPTV